MKVRNIRSITIAFALLTAVIAFQPTGARSEETPAEREVVVGNFTFSPSTLTVPVNSAVAWVNKDDVPHVIASDDGSFKSKTLDTDEKYSYTFRKAGTYQYYCSVHPKMVGTIVVQ